MLPGDAPKNGPEKDSNAPASAASAPAPDPEVEKGTEDTSRYAKLVVGEKESKKGGKPALEQAKAVGMDTYLSGKLESTLSSLTESADSILSTILASGFITTAEAREIETAAANGDADALNGVIQSASEKAGESKDGYNNLTLLISLISLLWFANMIRGCIQGKPVSFIKHHLPFVVGLLAMSTQIPQEVLHGLMESLVAFVAIMGISRAARGVTTKVDFSQLTEEQAQTVLVTLGPLASLITTPALATIFAPLGEKLSTRDRYIAMHSLANVDGGVNVGDFPFLWVWMQKGIVEGAIWQAKLMLPIMLFNKIMQAIFFKVGPAKIWKHKGLIWNVIKGFNFDKKRLTKSHEIVAEETALLREFLEYVRTNIGQLEHEVGPEAVAAINTLIEKESAVAEQADEAEAKDEAGSEGGLSEKEQQLKRFKMLEGELAEVLEDKEFLAKHVREAVVVLRRALNDGKITREELAAFHMGHQIDQLQKKVPGLGGVVKNLEIAADQKYAKICEKLKFSHNEVEIGRVFTAQALAVGVLVPVISTFLENVPAATEAVANVTSAIADNYAATAITWVSSNAKALSFSILAGTLTIYGNMANLNFLGKNANFMESVKYARYMLPTLLFAWMMTNPEKVQGLTENPTALAASLGTVGVMGLAYRFRDRILAMLGKKAPSPGPALSPEDL